MKEMPVNQKENVPLQQSPPNFANAAPAGAKTRSISRGKKRTLAVKDDYKINLNDAKIPATDEVVEAMRKRILELEDQLEGQSAAKRRKVSKAAEEEPMAGPSASASAKTSKAKDNKAESKKIDAIIKNIWSSLQKEIKGQKYKFSGGAPKVCRIEEVIEAGEFSTIFTNGIGQPSPDNKAGSVVTKLDYTAEDVEKLFGKHYKELKGNRYTPGGNWCKSIKIGLVALKINGLQVSYSKNTMKCAMKFEIEEAEPYEDYCMPRRVYWVRDN